MLCLSPRYGWLRVKLLISQRMIPYLARGNCPEPTSGTKRAPTVARTFPRPARIISGFGLGLFGLFGFVRDAVDTVQYVDEQIVKQDGRCLYIGMVASVAIFMSAFFHTIYIATIY